MTVSPPRGLAAQGRALWRDVLADLPESWELDARELAVLTAAARQVDVIATLEALVKRDGMTVTGSAGQLRLHPALAEARAGRVVLSRLLGELKMPQGEQERPMTTASMRAQHAANARWAQHAARRTARA